MAAFYNNFCEKMILPIADSMTQQQVMKLYKFHKESQWWNRQRLVDHQNACLSETLKIVYNEVPFYKNLYDSCNIDINSVRTVTDLTLLPFVTKDMLRASYPDICTRNTTGPWREYCTSGSSGKPFAVRVDNLTMSHARALMLLRANFAGWNIGDSFLQTGMTLDRGIVKKWKDKLLRVQYVSAFNLSDSVLDSYLDLIDRKKLKYIMGYTGGIYCLASRAIEIGFNLKLKGVVSWGDNLYEHYRDKIERAFNCSITDTYGCGEGIQIAAQCGMNNGAYHVFMPHVVVETVDDAGYPVEPGELGNVVLTRLDPGVMPLIRYKVGDIARKSSAESCPCGRGLEMLTTIEGRDTDVIVTPNGNRLIVHFFTGILEYYQSVDTFKVIQEKLDEIIIEIVPRPDFKKADWEQIKGEILQKGDPDLKIELKIVENIPLEISNKRRFVVSKIT
ncbi:MAG: phenylacetate-CoA ligase [Desulforhopalus sp.]|jgi:phenylacetate-CoA ligase